MPSTRSQWQKIDCEKKENNRQWGRGEGRFILLRWFI